MRSNLAVARINRGVDALNLHPDRMALDVETIASDIIADILHALDNVSRRHNPQATLDRAMGTYLGDREDS